MSYPTEPCGFQRMEDGCLQYIIRPLYPGGYIHVNFELGTWIFPGNNQLTPFRSDISADIAHQYSTAKFGHLAHIGLESVRVGDVLLLEVRCKLHDLQFLRPACRPRMISCRYDIQCILLSRRFTCMDCQHQTADADIFIILSASSVDRFLPLIYSRPILFVNPIAPAAAPEPVEIDNSIEYGQQEISVSELEIQPRLS